MPIKFCLPNAAFSISAGAYPEIILSCSFAYPFIPALQLFRFFFNFQMHGILEFGFVFFFLNLQSMCER